MARLNKKLFGNRNIGTTGTTDNAIGGEGIASINWSTLGSFAGNGALAVNGLALPAPTLPGGVQATWTLLFEVDGVSTGAGKTNLAVGDTFGSASFPGMIAKVTDLSGANAVFSLTTTGASRGNSLTISDLLLDTVGVTLTKIAGTGTANSFLVDVTYRVKSTAIVEKGSGYTGAETFTVTLSGSGTTGTPPAGTLVLTTDSGNVGSSTNQENALVPYAKTTSGGTSKAADIIRQVGARRFKVKTADGTAICTLKSSAVSAAGEMTLTATDSAGGTYFVTKIGSRRATITQGTGTQFATGDSVPWTFGAATQDVTVKIANA